MYAQAFCDAKDAWGQRRERVTGNFSKRGRRTVSIRDVWPVLWMTTDGEKARR